MIKFGNQIPIFSIPSSLKSRIIINSKPPSTISIIVKKSIHKMSSPKLYDIIIIGSGQSGTPLSTTFSSSNKSTLLIEKSSIGGTCINYGCTPTKTMISSGRVGYLSRRAQDYGVLIDNKEGIKIDMKKIRQRKRDIVESFRGGSEGRLERGGVEVIYGEARFLKRDTLGVKLNDGGEEVVKGGMIFINTGERPADPKITGIERVEKERVLDSTSIMELDVLPEHLVVVGGGYVELEFGQLFRRLGSRVTVVSRGRQVLGREDEDVANEVLKILKEDGLEVYLNSETTKIDGVDGGFKLFYKEKNGEEKSVEGSHLLYAAGRVPNTDMLDLESAGVEVNERGYVKCNEFLQTSAEGVYVMGDVKGPPAFTHISYDDFRIIRNNLITASTDSSVQKLSIKNRMVPYTVYIDPQLGHIGLHENEARKLHPNKNIKVAKMPMSYVARALETDETRGFMKAVVDGDTGEILGFTCLGIEGGEIMSIVQMAMIGNVKWKTLQDTTFAHPTLAESLNNLWGFLE